jgi:hypothetical protein
MVGKTVPAVDAEGNEIGKAEILDPNGKVLITLDDGQVYYAVLGSDERVPR